MQRQLISFDWALKKLLRNKANFDILEGFLSELLFQDLKIIQILESESNQENHFDKQNRVDLLVENTENELLIIEIQYETEHDYLQRILYGTSKVIIENMERGMPYSKIKKVFSISILYFDLGQGKDYIYKGTTNFVGLHYQDVLQLNQSQRDLYKNKEVFQLFPEYYLIKVNNFNQIAENTLDEWIHFLKNEEIKPEFRAKGIQKAKEEFNIFKMSKQEQQNYKRYLGDLSYEASMHESSYVVGQLETQIKIAKAMKAEGISNELIEKLTGLTKERIEKL